jgi:aryl-alcohol dehydrogenase-like predicted oxidoreductase
MARGLLTERYLDPALAGPGDRLFDEQDFEEKTTPDVIQKLRKLSKIAHESGLELNQLVIAYMLSIPGMGPVIPSSSNIGQLASNAAAGRFVLDIKVRQLIEACLHSKGFD